MSKISAQIVHFKGRVRAASTVCDQLPVHPQTPLIYIRLPRYCQTAQAQRGCIECENGLQPFASTRIWCSALSLVNDLSCHEWGLSALHNGRRRSSQVLEAHASDRYPYLTNERIRYCDHVPSMQPHGLGSRPYR